MGAPKIVGLSAGLRDNENRVLPINSDGPCWWVDGQYAWFHVPGLPGGTDAYARSLGAVGGLGKAILTDITSVLRVRPLEEWEAKSCGPRYASVSTIRARYSLPR